MLSGWIKLVSAQKSTLKVLASIVLLPLKSNVVNNVLFWSVTPVYKPSAKLIEVKDLKDE